MEQIHRDAMRSEDSTLRAIFNSKELLEGAVRRHGLGQVLARYYGLEKAHGLNEAHDAHLLGLARHLLGNPDAEVSQLFEQLRSGDSLQTLDLTSRALQWLESSRTESSR